MNLVVPQGFIDAISGEHLCAAMLAPKCNEISVMNVAGLPLNGPMAVVFHRVLPRGNNSRHYTSEALHCRFYPQRLGGLLSGPLFQASFFTCFQLGFAEGQALFFFFCLACAMVCW